MARKRKQRRQQHGSAWHWRQTDCWYYTEPGTRKPVALFDEEGKRIRGKENKEAARLALARAKLVVELNPSSTAHNQKWTVARVFEVYLADLRRAANREWAKQVQNWLNDLCSYCGALSVEEFKKKHLRDWIQKKTTWNHNTQRNVIASVKAAFNFCAVSSMTSKRILSQVTTNRQRHHGSLPLLRRKRSSFTRVPTKPLDYSSKHAFLRGHGPIRNWQR